MNQRETLSQEQVEALRKSPHVRLVNANLISFTAEFKEYAYEEHQRGIPYREILSNVGIDPALLSKKRMESLSSSINRQVRRGVGFSDMWKKAPLPIEKRKAKTIEEKVTLLQHELAYTRQEVEYLKKIYLADREAQRKCDLKPRRKLSSESSGT